MTSIKTVQKSINYESKIVLGLFGAGGFAREVMPVAIERFSAINKTNLNSYEILFIETNPSSAEVNGVPIISEKDFFEIKCLDKFFNVAIGDSKVREKIAENCIKLGIKPESIISQNAIIYKDNDLGVGSIICVNSMVTANSKIGKFFHSNIYSYVGHDCIIGDYVTFAPNVHCNGNIHIHNHAYIGTGAIIKQGSLSKPLVIGEGAVIGMGAVVTKDVEPYTTVIGNPARPYQKS